MEKFPPPDPQTLRVVTTHFGGNHKGTLTGRRIVDPTHGVALAQVKLDGVDNDLWLPMEHVMNLDYDVSISSTATAESPEAAALEFMEALRTEDGCITFAVRGYDNVTYTVDVQLVDGSWRARVVGAHQEITQGISKSVVARDDLIPEGNRDVDPS